ncbi:hypothetical protein [Pigmentiphaga aceris]|nr:hypothetical protein [Pigmentiphaga aceris]
MKIFQEGDQSRAVCSHCADLVVTTFRRRDVPFSDGSSVAKNILVGVCDVCDTTVSIPAQSTPAISKTRKEATASIEANLPAIYVDVLDYAVHTIDHRASTDFRRVLLSYFLHQAAGDAQLATKLKAMHAKALVRFPEHRGVARRRLSMKVPVRVSEDLQSLATRTELNTTELLKSVVCSIQDDVLTAPKPKLIQALQGLAAISI